MRNPTAWYSIDVDAWITRGSLMWAVVATLSALGLFYNNYTLAQNNRELVGYVGKQMEAFEAEITMLRSSDIEIAEALGVGSVEAASVLRDKK